jgi:D-proline reductase (dithiol) PrdB
MDDVFRRMGGPPIDLPCFGPPPLEPVGKPASELNVGLLASLGVRGPDQPPFETTNDLTYRRVPPEVPSAELVFDHETPVRWWADLDLGVAFPRDRLGELAEDGTIGALAPVALSILGTISLYDRLVNETVPGILDDFTRQDVDLVLLVPF